MPKKLEIHPSFVLFADRYAQKMLSISDMAASMSVSKATILKWMDLHAIARHDPSVMISIKKTGKPGHRKGARHTEESRRKMSEANKGRITTLGFVFSAESKQRMREAAIRRVATTDALLKMREGRKKNQLPEKERIARAKVRHACKSMLRRILTMARTKKDGRRSEHMLGYSKAQLRDHLESQFKIGMSWSDRGSFHIDHIKPVAQFFREGITDPAVINALSNLQVLTPSENMEKSDKFERPFV